MAPGLALSSSLTYSRMAYLTLSVAFAEKPSRYQKWIEWLHRQLSPLFREP
jgi:hypothetical protein